MNNYKILQYSLITIAILLMATLAAHAQILPPPPQPPPGGAGVPLDPVSWVVLGAGGLYAYKKYKNSNTEE
jgi:N-acetylneuraminic acid mutarotase